MFFLCRAFRLVLKLVVVNNAYYCLKQIAWFIWANNRFRLLQVFSSTQLRINIVFHFDLIISQMIKHCKQISNTVLLFIKHCKQILNIVLLYIKHCTKILYSILLWIKHYIQIFDILLIHYFTNDVPKSSPLLYGYP